MKTSNAYYSIKHSSNSYIKNTLYLYIITIIVVVAVVTLNNRVLVS